MIKGWVHYDEKYVIVNEQNCYDLNAVDSKTKYVLAHSFVEKRTFSACVDFLSQIKRTCYGQILKVFLEEKHKKAKSRKLVTFVCDGYWTYRLAFNKLFYGVAKLVFNVPIACKKYGLKHNNNPAERYNQNLDDRIKVMRNFKSFSNAKSFFDLHRICRNFINPCMQLQGITPAEAAGVKLPLDRNKLLDLIKHIRRNHITKR